MKIFTQSWHNRLATFYGPIYQSNVDRQVNFCDYFWAAFKGGIGVLGILFASVLIGLPLGHIIAWVSWMAINFAWIAPTSLAISGIGLLLPVVLIFSVAAINMLVAPRIKDKLAEKRKTRTLEKAPGFFTLWWYSIKNKVCVPIVIKGDAK